MNNQELIKEIEENGIYCLNVFGNEVKSIPVKRAIALIKQLDEPQKVKIPQCVADWIKECKEKGDLSLGGAIQLPCPEIYEWLMDWNNQETFARAWLDGYEVEKEKRYVVKVKGNIKENMLVYGEFVERYFFTKSSSLYNIIYHHTRKELEEAGFGWVFDCPGIEIEEVE